MKVEISDARWEAITKVARCYGLPAQVVLDHILDKVLGHGLDPTDLLDLGLLRAAAATPDPEPYDAELEEIRRELYGPDAVERFGPEVAEDEPAATAVRAAEESLAHLRSRLQDIAEPFHQDPSPYEDADHDYDGLVDITIETGKGEGTDYDAPGDGDGPAVFYDFDYEPEFD